MSACQRPIVYDRDALYDDVWNEPVREAAKKYGISDVALAKTCRKLAVPLPSRGYWARLKAGHQQPRPPLPPAPEDARPIFCKVALRVQDTLGEEAKLLIEREQRMPKIEVRSDQANRHSLLHRFEPILRNMSRMDEKVLTKEACLDVRVTKTTLGRALRVVDALFQSLEDRGFSIEVTDPVPANPPTTWGKQSATGVRILGHLVEFYVEELTDTTKVQSPSEKHGSGRSAWVYTPPPYYERKPNGRLAIRIKERFRAQRHAWKDGKVQRIENCLNKMIIELIKAADEERERAIALQRWKEREEAERLRIEKERRRREQEERLVSDLECKLHGWRQAKDILELAEVVEKVAIERGEDLSEGSRTAQWLAWARGRARLLRTNALALQGNAWSDKTKTTGDS